MNIIIRGRLIFATLSFTVLVAAMIFSLQAPLYPAEAQRKNATATEFGLVLASHEIVVMVASPIIGSHINTFGVRRAFNLGILTATTSCTLFGFLERVNDRFWFVGLSLMLRMIEAVGVALISIAVFSCIGKEFPETVGTTFGMVEAVIGVGNAIGPFIGSVLFQIGGFGTPFFAIGGLHLVSGFATNSIIWGRCSGRKTEQKRIAKKPKTEETVGLVSLLKQPAQIFYFFVAFTGATGAGFLTALMQTRLAEFGMGPLSVGYVFLIYSGAYAGSSALVGLIAGRMKKPELLLVLGAGLGIISFTLVGPVPFLPIEPSFPLMLGAIVVSCIGGAMFTVTPFTLSTNEAKRHGFTDMASVSGIISSMFLSSVTLGGFVGPTIAGVLYDAYGFRSATLSILALDILLSLAIVLYLMTRQGFISWTGSRDKYDLPLSSKSSRLGLQ